MTILIVGGGKMGLSHFAIANRIVGPGNAVVCDAGWMIRQIYKRLNVMTFSSIEKSISSGLQIDGVVIATPTHSHFSVAKTFLDRAVPCFIEKPLTLSSTLSQQLVDMAQLRHVYAQVGFVLRYVATFVKLREVLASGHFGNIRRYRARMSGNVITKPSSDSWRTNFDSGGGCLNEYGPHLIDLCRFVFGNVSHLNDAQMGHIHSANADDWVDFAWTHTSGVAGEVKLNWCDTTKRKSVIDFEVELDKAIIKADNSAFHITLEEGAVTPDALRSELFKPLLPPNVSFYLRGEEYTLQLEDFIGNCMNANHRVDREFGLDLSATLRDGLEVDRLIETIADKVGLR